MNLWLTLLLTALGLAAAVALIAVYLRRVFDVALTDQFRAAETIYNGRTPPQWVGAISQQLAVRRLLPWRPTASGAQLAVQRVERLVQFFARGPFFEDEATRARLLADLRQAQTRWAGMTWDQIKAEAAPAANEDK